MCLLHVPKRDTSIQLNKFLVYTNYKSNIRQTSASYRPWGAITTIHPRFHCWSKCTLQNYWPEFPFHLTFLILANFIAASPVRSILVKYLYCLTLSFIKVKRVERSTIVRCFSYRNRGLTTKRFYFTFIFVIGDFVCAVPSRQMLIQRHSLRFSLNRRDLHYTTYGCSKAFSIYGPPRAFVRFNNNQWIFVFLLAEILSPCGWPVCRFFGKKLIYKHIMCIKILSKMAIFRFLCYLHAGILVDDFRSRREKDCTTIRMCQFNWFGEYVSSTNNLFTGSYYFSNRVFSRKNKIMSRLKRLVTMKGISHMTKS